MTTRALILLITVGFGLGLAAASFADDDPQFFCCDSVGTNADGKRTGERCRHVTESQAAKCEDEVMACPGSWTMKDGVVICAESD